ncbi:kynureninase [Massilia sp. TS11]|uniref:kynureninase n=1 Tax=Massilia sp. TS11 TaxID=2908003 RepID=UPI001EDB10E0|nr:kynureninase [Massilia sp. TS11]MCG2583315.1 kynureninase [Massilia sp. TS11]
MTTRQDCLDRDASDPLAALRHAFDLPEGVIYLDGNSLGARPKAAAQRAAQLVSEEWGRDLIKSWNTAGWYTLPARLGDKLAPLVGAAPGEIVITDTTSVNLFKALAACLQMQAASGRKRIVSERANFPTDLYMAEGLAGWLGQGHELVLVDTPEQVLDAVDADTAVLMLTHVNYRTGYQHDMAALTRAAQSRGALVIWDLAHSAGAVPVDLHAAGADMAVGCTYKYLNGGPGAPGYLWVPQRHQAAFRQPLSGWWSHANPFAMDSRFAPVDGIRRALCGTVPVLSLALVECGLDVFARTDMTAIRAKSLALSDLFIELVETRLAAYPLSLVTPRAHAQRGSQVCLAHPHAYALIQALIGRGVIGDYREPGIMRFGFTPLYTRYSDVWDAVDILHTLLDQQDYDIHAHRHAVT